MALAFTRRSFPDKTWLPQPLNSEAFWTFIITQNENLPLIFYTYIINNEMKIIVSQEGRLYQFYQSPILRVKSLFSYKITFFQKTSFQHFHLIYLQKFYFSSNQKIGRLQPPINVVSLPYHFTWLSQIPNMIMILTVQKSLYLFPKSFESVLMTNCHEKTISPFLDNQFFS